MASALGFPRAHLGSALSACTLRRPFALRGSPSAPRARHSPPAHTSRALAHRPVALHTLAVRTLAW